ncbi:Uncharacterized protein HA466_0207690 [Hirschfeldia incana]|nr:Uncharacterized protein HA466_0207690 [Hirschfeldia incana]
MKTLNLLPLIFFLSSLLSPVTTLAAFSELGYSTESTPASSSSFKGEFYEPEPSHTSFSYDRLTDVRRNCKSVLSSASELNIDPISRDLRKSKKNLSFRNGDWSQSSGDSPILPFDDSTTTNNTSSSSSIKPLNLVSFRVTDLDLPHRTKRYVGVNGVLLLAITAFNDLTSRGVREFELWPSHTQLKINFQGVYVENDKDQERVLCMLGETMLPSRDDNNEKSPSDPWKWVKEHDTTPPLLQDDQIRLILRYPKAFTLTKREIIGEVKSLNEKPNLKYFDKITISSQLSKSNQYSFVADELVSNACDGNGSTISGIDVYKGKGFCNLLQRVVSQTPLTVLPNWKCNGTDAFCRKLGPFGSDGDGSFKGVNLYMQNIHCQETAADSVTKVSAVFRAVRPSENLYLSGKRSSLDNMTVTAEGAWKPSTGQLCMVACRRGEVDLCNARVCLYIPTTFSIRQRSILVGTFSCLDKKNLSFSPLSFEKLVEPMDMQNYFQSSLQHPFYRYSKTDEAGGILERNQEFSFGTIIKKSVMKFPKLEDSEDSLSSLSLLAEDLTFHTPAFTEKKTLVTNFGMDVLSLGPLFGLFWRSSNFSSIEEQTQTQTPYKTKDQYTEKQLLLNVSAQISLTGDAFGNVSKIYLEGLYDEHTGRMYLVGCRDVRASWEVLSASGDLEDGLDCLVDVVVSYPPIKSRWLADPTAKVSISSRRPDDDPLYFKQLKLKTTPIFYRRQREDILSRAGVEGILRVLTLTFSIGCIASQLFYFRTNADSVPFVSLVMLGVQALGYSLPLITGAEALFKRKAASPTAYETPSYDLQKSQWFNVIDYTVKLLVMVCFLLTLRLCQKVWKSRVRLVTRTTPQEPHRVPSDKRVLLVSLFLHALGYILALVLHPARTERFTPVYGAAGTNWWQTETEEYIGLVQDFFLLPQVIANFIWQIDSKQQPLRKLYYLGITLVRLFPHVYDYLVGSVPDPYFIGEEHEFVNPNLDFFSKFGDVAIPVTAVLLAVIVFVQQRWDYDKLSQALSFGRFRILPSRSVKYERVMSESEMVSRVSVNGNHSDEE